MRIMPRVQVTAMGWLACFALSCGSEGSLGESGQTNGWSFEGMGGRKATASGGTASTPSSTGGSAFEPVSSGGSGSTPQSAAGGQSTPVGSIGGPAPGASMPPASANGGSPGTGGSASTSTLYHQLADWAGVAANNPNHHGRVYFLGRAHQDENGLECTSCHGANYEGDTGPACASCHQEWRSSCSFCHGTDDKGAPPRGIYDETSTATLAVGRHAAHLAASNSHVAFPCTACHTVPPANDVDHTLEYQPSNDLTTPGHHGDVTFTGIPAGMKWSEAATTGSPVSARGTCVGSCHSNGQGGAPVKTPYWAGGTWTSGCGNCHASAPRTGYHSHALQEGGTCANCHAGSTPTTYASANHMNGKVEYLGTVAGEGMTLRADNGCASGVRCSGACHGESEDHNRCW